MALTEEFNKYPEFVFIICIFSINTYNLKIKKIINRHIKLYTD